MTDLIDRQAAIDAVSRGCQEFRGIFTECEKNLNELPSAQPEIIRCKDCKYWMPYDWMFSEMWKSQSIYDYTEEEIGCQFCDMSMKAADFCSRAERREDE